MIAMCLRAILFLNSSKYRQIVSLLGKITAVLLQALQKTAEIKRDKRGTRFSEKTYTMKLIQCFRSQDVETVVGIIFDYILLKPAQI